jgi:uncharacterized protein with PIN domain
VPVEQLAEVIQRFDLANMLRPFYRCSRCNGLIESVEKQDVLQRLQPKTRLYYETFCRCRECGQIYWQGSHIDKIKARFTEYFP